MAIWSILHTAIWYILRPFGLFKAIWYAYFVAIWKIFWLFGIYCGDLVFCTKKYLATLIANVCTENGLTREEEMCWENFPQGCQIFRGTIYQNGKKHTN
jgi:hypothetical protein